MTDWIEKRAMARTIRGEELTFDEYLNGTDTRDEDNDLAENGLKLKGRHVGDH